MELVREAARMAADSPGKSRAAVLRSAARARGERLDRRFLSQDVERLEEALRQYQLTFRPERESRLRALREAAAEAMRFFRPFRPRLVGAALSGVVDEYAMVELHLFAPTPETVLQYLIEHDIPFEESEAHYAHADGRRERVSRFLFLAGEEQVCVDVFPERGVRERPLDENGAKIERAGLPELERLLA
jgi:hypothetical protein